MILLNTVCKSCKVLFTTIYFLWSETWLRVQWKNPIGFSGNANFRAGLQKCAIPAGLYSCRCGWWMLSWCVNFDLRVSEDSLKRESFPVGVRKRANRREIQTSTCEDPVWRRFNSWSNTSPQTGAAMMMMMMMMMMSLEGRLLDLHDITVALSLCSFLPAALPFKYLVSEAAGC